MNGNMSFVRFNVNVQWKTQIHNDELLENRMEYIILMNNLWLVEMNRDNNKVSHELFSYTTELPEKEKLTLTLMCNIFDSYRVMNSLTGYREKSDVFLAYDRVIFCSLNSFLYT